MLGWGSAEKPWNPMQIRVLTCLADEIALLGGKGSGKSLCARAWLVTGNPHLPKIDDKGNQLLVNWSYIYHPEYRGLILRRNQEDLDDFIARAIEMYKPYGGDFVNGRFQFLSGATVDCGHMKDRNSWQKYLGIEYQRVVIDEAALIPEFESYEQLRSCLRTTDPSMRMQMLVTSNANGPGAGWLKERFMRARDKQGNVVPHDTVIEEEYDDPDTGKKFMRSRIWIFSTYKDNPAVVKTGYGRQLATLSDPKMRRAYLEGDWDAFFGSYFSDLFRPEGPHPNEPPNAMHVVPPKALTPWWHRSIGMDWGYAHESAVLWGCRDLQGRFYIYRELAASQVSPERMGFEIAKATRDELEKIPSHSITMHLSHDAFQNRTGDRSIAEIIALGIARVLGPNAIHLPDLMMKAVKDAYFQDGSNPMAQIERDRAIEKIRLQKRTGITIRIAEKTGIIGWQHVRELMRWESIGEINNGFDAALGARILQEGGPAKFNEYVSLHRDIKPEVLPKLQIFDTCPRIIDAIPKAQHVDGEEEMDKKHFFGKDLVDSLLYLCLGSHDEFPEEPFEAFREDMMTKLRQREPDATVMSLVLANQEWESQFKSKNVLAPYTPPRAARMRRLLAQKLVPDQRNRIDDTFGDHHGF